MTAARDYIDYLQDITQVELKFSRKTVNQAARLHLLLEK